MLCKVALYGPSDLYLKAGGRSDRQSNMSDSIITIGDKVRIRRTAMTEAMAIAGREGLVDGTTVPSATGIEPIGDTPDDHAVCVYFDHLQIQLWFAPDLVEFVDHSPGLTVDIGGHKYIRDADGQWHLMEPE